MKPAAEVLVNAENKIKLFRPLYFNRDQLYFAPTEEHLYNLCQLTSLARKNLSVSDRQPQNKIINLWICFLWDRQNSVRLDEWFPVSAVRTLQTELVHMSYKYLTFCYLVHYFVFFDSCIRNMWTIIIKPSQMSDQWWKWTRELKHFALIRLETELLPFVF